MQTPPNPALPPTSAPSFARSLAKAKSLPKRSKRMRRKGEPKPIKPRRKGRLSDDEKSIIDAIIITNQGNIEPSLAKATGLILNRDAQTTAHAMAKAREKFAANASNYVDIHKAAVDLALANDDPDVARKGAEWAIEHMSARHSDGKVERIIEAAATQDTQPKIMIGINLGGLGALPGPRV